MRKALKAILLLLTVCLVAINGQAQVYPVSGNGVLIPPYSVYLADYTAGTSDRLILNLVLNDVTRPELRVRLRTKIIGQNITLETKPEYTGKEFILQGGIPLRITGSELTEYFSPANLNFSGITKREFEKTGALPAGFYQFCFEVLEYNRGVKISNSICANGWLILNDPPLINLPRNGEKLVPTQPQNVVFQWTPRHTGSPNSAFSTEYDIKLVELWPANRNPNDAILTSPPILEETTRGTTFIYDVSQTPLEAGRHYALQVKARSIVGAEELDLFKNNGKSEVITFIYGDPCTVPQSIFAESNSASRFTVKWTGGSNYTAYSLKYRLADSPTAAWYTSTTLTPDAGISGLQPGTMYEYQVAGSCGNFESEYSGIARIKTLSMGEQGYTCGMPLEQFNLDPANLIDALKVGDVIQAGDFDVKIAKVSGSSGTFSGEGVIEVPFFNKAKVKAEFSSIVVNKDMRMVSGYMNVTGAGVEIVPAGVTNFIDQLSETLSALDTALTHIENNLPKPFDEYAFVADTVLPLPGPVIVSQETDGSVVITDANGNEHRLPQGTEAAVVDDQGNGTLIDANGKAHNVSAAVATAAGNREYNLMLRFAESQSNHLYGFDAITSGAPDGLKKLYDKLEDDYYVPFKAIETGKTDLVSAIFEGTAIDKSKLRFERGGVPVTASPFSGNNTTVTVSANMDGEQEALIAVLPAEGEGAKDQVLGQVNVVTYNQIQKVVHIVPVNGNNYKFGSAGSLQNELNKIYSQAVVSWSVQIENGIQVEGINPFNVGETGLLTNYTDHMKKVISAYKTAASMQNDENNFYLFLVNAPSDPKIAGYMPRSKQSGFIFSDQHNSEAVIARTMAHELGHGAFNLHHTFMEENFSLPKNSTDNLMDYAEGTKLYKYQWDMIRYPAVVMGVFESDREAESVTITDLTAIIDYINEDKKTFTFLSPAGKPITIPANARDVVFATGERWITEAFKIVPLGTLIQFTVNDRILRARSDLSNFIGYNDNTGFYIDSLTNKINPKFAILGYPCFNNSNNLTFSVYQKSIAGYEISNNYTASGILKPFDFDLYTFYNDQHVNGKQISAVHSLSAEAQDYLAIRTEFAGCSNPLAPYIFINAYQITYNPNTYYFCEASQDYSNSILDRLPKPSSGATITDPFKNYYDEVHKWVDGADVYRERTKILTEFKNLSSITDTDKILDVLTKYENYECLWKTISVGDRKYVLQKLIDGHVNDYWIGLGNNKENLFNQLLKTTEVADRSAIIDLFETKNYELLRKAYSKLDVGSNDIFIGILSSWISKIKYYEMSSVSSLNEQPALSSNGYSWQVPEKLFLWRNEDGAIKDRHIDWESEGNYFSYYSDNLHAKFTFSPFDIVKIKFESNFAGGINKGLEIVVPAIWAYRFQQNFYNKKLTDLARYLLDAAVIAGTLGSGTSTVALIEVGFAGTDMFLIASKDQLISSFGKDGENLLHNWDNLYMAYAGYTGVKQIAQSAGRMQLAFSLDDIASSFNKFSQEKRISITQNLKNFGDILKKLGQQGKIQNWEPAYYKFLDYIRTTQLQSLIADAPNLAQQVVIKVQDQVRVIVFNSFFNYQLAKFDIRNGEIFLSELKWISLSQEGSFQVLGAINPITYEDRLLRVVSRKKLEIVFHDSKVYLREINSADDVLSHSFINGYSFEEISKIPKLNRLNPEAYLSSEYISNHLGFFKSEGGAFVVVKSWIEESSRTEFPLKKYVMLKSDMLKVVDEYKRLKDIKILENGLGYSQDALKGLENEIYIFYAESNRFKFDMPSGNEAGANLFWTPGGKTFGGLKEAVIIDLENPTIPLKHNKSIEYLKTRLKHDKLIN